MTALFNECRCRIFLCVNENILAYYFFNKTNNEKSLLITNIRPISFLPLGGKMLEKLSTDLLRGSFH